MRATYFKGVRLWEATQEAPAWGERTGDMEHDGLHQDYKTANPQSPNIERSISVKTVVESRVDSSAISGIDLVDSIENTLHAVEALLIANMRTLGDLAYVPDDTRRAAITTGHVAGSAQIVVIGTPAGGWTPTTGRYVLVRSLTTGHGFVTSITVSGSNITLASIPEDVASTGWEMIDCVRAVREVAYMRMDGGEARGEDDPQRDRKEVTYEFKAFGTVVYASATLLTGYTT